MGTHRDPNMDHVRNLFSAPLVAKYQSLRTKMRVSEFIRRPWRVKESTKHGTVFKTWSFDSLRAPLEFRNLIWLKGATSSCIYRTCLPTAGQRRATYSYKRSIGPLNSFTFAPVGQRCYQRLASAL